MVVIASEPKNLIKNALRYDADYSDLCVKNCKISFKNQDLSPVSYR